MRSRQRIEAVNWRFQAHAMGSDVFTHIGVDLGAKKLIVV